jgi:hypothetical protein
MPRTTNKNSERDDVEERELTAQPKSVPEELRSHAVQEAGLSVDPEDLGRQFLSEATEQGNFESSRGGESSELWVNDAAPSDDALPGPNFDGERSIWENTVSMTMENGGARGAQGAVSPRGPSDDDDELADEDGLLSSGHDGDVDLTESSIRDGSLLDHEASELGETASPRVQTDDTHSYAKKRGGHAPVAASAQRKGARGQHRAR